MPFLRAVRLALEPTTKTPTRTRFAFVNVFFPTPRRASSRINTKYSNVVIARPDSSGLILIFLSRPSKRAVHVWLSFPAGKTMNEKILRSAKRAADKV